MTTNANNSGSQQAGEVMRRVEELPDTSFVALTLGSIALSAIFMMMKKREAAIFVGLWPPTILNLARMMKDRRPSRELQSGQAT